MAGVMFSLLKLPASQHFNFGQCGRRRGMSLLRLGSTEVRVKNSSLGRNAGGIHGHRGKGRRRRSRKADGSLDSQDDAEKQSLSECTVDDEEDLDDEAEPRRVKDGRTIRGKKFRRRTSKLEEVQFTPPAEEVAPVAMTILTDPEMFEAQTDAASADNGAEASSVVAAEKDVAEEKERAVKAEEPQKERAVEAQEQQKERAVEAEESQKERAVEIQSQVIEKVSYVAEQVAEQVTHLGQKVVDDVLPETVVAQAGQVADQVSHVAEVLVEQVASILSSDQEEENESDDEFEAYTTSDLPEFRGMRGLENFTILQEDAGVLRLIYDFYLYMLKQSVLEFSFAMITAPVAISVFFTVLYLPQLQGLAFEDTAKGFLQTPASEVLQLSWATVFQVFMFSLSLATGLEPELAPLTPYTQVVANVNALFAQLIFVFLSGAVFARLSQPSQPIRCSPVALVSPPPASYRQAPHRVFMTRYVLVGPQPCELVDVKVDLSYKYNTMTRTGSYFRATESLKLVRSEVAYVNHGMLVRHIIDDTSPLKKRTADMMRKEDGIFTLSVVGLERSSMQSVFHAQHYSVSDDHVIWDAEFEDMILINKKNRRIVDHSRLSLWKPVSCQKGKQH